MGAGRLRLPILNNVQLYLASLAGIHVIRPFLGNFDAVHRQRHAGRVDILHRILSFIGLCAGIIVGQSCFCICSQLVIRSEVFLNLGGQIVVGHDVSIRQPGSEILFHRRGNLAVRAFVLQAGNQVVGILTRITNETDPVCYAVLQKPQMRKIPRDGAVPEGSLRHRRSNLQDLSALQFHVPGSAVDCADLSVFQKNRVLRPVGIFQGINKGFLVHGQQRADLTGAGGDLTGGSVLYGDFSNAHHLNFLQNRLQRLVQRRGITRRIIICIVGNPSVTARVGVICQRLHPIHVSEHADRI